MRQRRYHADFDPVPSENTDEQWNYGKLILIRLVATVLTALAIVIGLVIAAVKFVSFCLQHQTWSVLTFACLLLCFGIWRMVKKLRK